MLRLVVLAAAAAALQTRETVQRVVLLRTSGSDLAPAATGYIYRKDGAGPERLERMPAGEVEAQLSRLYTRPADTAHAAPVSESPADGGDYAPRYDDDYQTSYKRFKDKLYRQYGDRAGAAGDADQRHSPDDAGTYHKAQFESYSISAGREKGRADEEPHEHYRGSGEDGRGAGRDRDGFHALYGDGDFGHYKYFDKGGKPYADDKYRGEDPGQEHRKHETKHDDAEIKHDKQDEASTGAPRDNLSPAERAAVAGGGAGDGAGSGAAGGAAGGAGGGDYGYEIKH